MGTSAAGTNDEGTAGAATGAAGSGGGDTGTPTPVPGGAGALDKAKLNPVLQGMDEDQINEVFDTMFGALRARNQGGSGEPDFSGVPAHARPRPAAQPSPEDQAAQLQKLRDKYKKMMDPSDDAYDPLTAMAEIAQLTMSPVIGSVNRRAIAGMLSSFRDNELYPGFKEVEQDIVLALEKRDPATITENDVLGTYLMVVGAKNIEEKRKAAKKPPTTMPPSPARETAPQKTATEQLSDIELTVARTMYRGRAKNDEEAAKMYLEDAELEQKGVQVPLGGGKKG